MYCTLDQTEFLCTFKDLIYKIEPGLSVLEACQRFISYIKSSEIILSPNVCLFLNKVPNQKFSILSFIPVIYIADIPKSQLKTENS